MQDLKLSIIVPVYNAERYLYNCVSALLNQEYKNIEIILIDDGSNDNSGKICEEIKSIDNRIKVFHQENEGPYSARNKGLDNAIGDLIGFVDSDDIVLPSMYAILIDNLVRYGADISACGRFRNVCGKPQKHEEINNVHVYNRSQALYELLGITKRLRPAVWDKIYKRELFKDLRFPNNYFEDAALTYKIISVAKKVIYTDAQLYQYTVREGSMITSPWGKKQLQSYFDINSEMENFFISIGDKGNLYNSYIWRIEFSIEAFEKIIRSQEISKEDMEEFSKRLKELCSVGHITKMSISMRKKMRYFLFPYIPQLSNKMLNVSFDFV